VTGVEVHRPKLRRLRVGESPVREPGLQAAFAAPVGQGRLRATDDLGAAVKAADVIMVTVGTPSDPRGDVQLDAVDRVTGDLADCLRHLQRPPVVMIRSTVPPGTVGKRVAPQLEEAASRVCVCHHPEFFREGSGLDDFVRPPSSSPACAPLAVRARRR
jgi:UDP-glucose 6-dehydrogenase